MTSHESLLVNVDKTVTTKIKMGNVKLFKP